MTAERTATDFCRTSPHAVIVTVWPTAHAQAAAARRWVEDCGGKILHDAEVAIGKQGAIATCLALYSGEDVARDQLLVRRGPYRDRDEPHAGARWKAALTWTQDAPLTPCSSWTHSETGGALWSWQISGEQLRREVGGLGNCASTSRTTRRRRSTAAARAAPATRAIVLQRAPLPGVLLRRGVGALPRRRGRGRARVRGRRAAYRRLAREDAPVGGASAIVV